MVGNTGFYACLNKMRNKNACKNNNIKAEFLDKQILKYLKENLLTKKFYEQFIKNIQKQFKEHKKESLSTQKQHIKRVAELDRQIEKLMELYTRDKIKTEIIEKSIEPLQNEKEEIQSKIGDLTQIDQVLEIKVEEFSSESIRHQLERFEEMFDDQNIHEMRSMVRDFIYKIVLSPKENPRSKKGKRRIHIQSYVRALTMITLASPTGFEPVLPA